MASIDKHIADVEAGREVTFNELYRVCTHFFGEPRNTGSSHFIFRTPWIGNPRINIQNNKGKAKRYQVAQVRDAIAKLRELKLAESKKTKK